ncbi:MAG: alpha-ketoglutarate-dependent dioxygenase AlkB family protein [Blastocatellia bacterium]
MRTRHVEMPSAEVVLHEGFFSPEESARLMKSLLAETAWGQGEIKIHGKLHAEPRLTAWHGDEGKSYSYSGIVLHPRPWTPLLAEIRERVDAAAGARFNSVLLNLYRDGRDSNGWHQDNEPELGGNPVIASVSFGATRRFQMRHKRRKELPRIDLDLEDGSLLVMAGPTQHFWRHQVPKTSRPVGARINLTFRVIQ